MSNTNSIFNSIAHNYDRFNHLSSMGVDRYWRYRTVQALRPVESLLDVAVGTADLSISILAADKANHVEGLDLSAEMIRVGEDKVQRAGLSDRMHFTEASALDMPYADGSFDALTCAYGVRNFSDLNAGLREFYRVLRPDGQLLILEFSYPRNAFIAALYDFYFRRIMTHIGACLTGDRAAFEYFYRSVKGFCHGEAMCDRLRAAGFRDVRYRTMTFGISTLYMARR